eukprot:g27160.t1
MPIESDGFELQLGPAIWCMELDCLDVFSSFMVVDRFEDHPEASANADVLTAYLGWVLKVPVLPRLLYLPVVPWRLGKIHFLTSTQADGPSIRSGQNRVVKYNHLINACKNQGDWQKALYLLRCLGEMNLRPGSRLEWRRSLELFATANDEQQLDVMLFNATLSALPWFSALRLLKKANIISYNSTLRDSMTWRQNLQQLEALQDLGLTPSRVSYNSAMSACDHDQADAWRSALGLATASNVITMSSVLSVAEKVSLWKSSLQLMTVAKRNHLEANVVTFNALLSSFPWYQALQLVSDVISFNSTISSCNRHAEWQRAVELLQRLEGSFLEPNVISFTSALASHEVVQWPSALLLLPEVQRRSVANMIFYNAALSVTAERWDQALRLFFQQKLHEPVERSCEPDEGPLRWREVLQLLQLSSERSVRCNLLSYAMCSEALASTPRRPKPSLRWALGRLEDAGRAESKPYPDHPFSPRLGKTVVELTGDFTPDIDALERADVVVTTPEKWDGISRHWQHRAYVRKVGLVIIDEIHLLGQERGQRCSESVGDGPDAPWTRQDRGPVLEVIVSRMRYISCNLDKAIRFVGLSTALANAHDIADWLGIGIAAWHYVGLYNFKPSVRPVPMTAHIQGYPEKHFVARMAQMNKPCFHAIKNHAVKHDGIKPTLIFVSSRRQTRLTALDIVAFMSADPDEDPKQFCKLEAHELECAGSFFFETTSSRGEHCFWPRTLPVPGAAMGAFPSGEALLSEAHEEHEAHEAHGNLFSKEFFSGHEVKSADVQMLMVALVAKVVTSLLALSLPTPTGVVAPALWDVEDAFEARLAILGASAFSCGVVRAYGVAITIYEALSLNQMVVPLSLSSLTAVFVADYISLPFFDTALVRKGWHGVSKLTCTAHGEEPAFVVMEHASDFPILPNTARRPGPRLSDLQRALDAQPLQFHFPIVEEVPNSHGRPRLLGALSRAAAEEAQRRLVQEPSAGGAGSARSVELMRLRWPDVPYEPLSELPLTVDPLFTVQELYITLKVARKEVAYITGHGVLLGRVGFKERTTAGQVGEVRWVSAEVTDQSLKHTLEFGIGIHHAGLPERDRKVVEELFVESKIMVLISTSTLAWGVNFPAHLVIIKGTEYYDGQLKRYVDFPITDVLQMMGRAGRPQFDTEARAVVMVHEPKKNFYRSFMYEPFPVESSLHEQLTDHLNAEIVAKTIRTREEAIDYPYRGGWRTYFFRRLTANPAYYDQQAALLETPDFEKQKAAPQGQSALVEPTKIGRIASLYYLSHRTVAQFQRTLAREGMSFVEIMRVLCECPEYDELPVRHNEDKLNAEFAEHCPLEATPAWSRPAWRPGWSSSESVDLAIQAYDSPHTKAFLLLQAHMWGIALPINDYKTDLKTVLDRSIPLIMAMVDIAAEEAQLRSTLNLILLLQCLHQAHQPWRSSLATLPHLSDKALRILRDFGVDSLPELIERRDASKILTKLSLPSADAHKELLQIVQDMPRLRVRDAEEKEAPTEAEEGKVKRRKGKLVPSPYKVPPDRELELTVVLCYDNEPMRFVHAPRFPKKKTYSWWCILGDTEAILDAVDELVSIKKALMPTRQRFEKRINFQFCSPADEVGETFTLSVLCMSDSFFGLDQQLDLSITTVEPEAA